ncbi:S8 family peptidase [Thermosulfuriphilus sp.]
MRFWGGSPGEKGALLSKVYDPQSKRYLAPLLPDHPFFQSLKKTHGQGYVGAGIKVAVLDTGLLIDHPWIRATLEDSVDFTGEGIDDLNGHGTIVALLLLAVAPRSRLFNVKVVRATGRGKEENLIKGIRWAVNRRIQTINISLGVYHPKWGLWECNGGCDLCQAAEEAARAGTIVVAAAGNEAGKTYCPAKVGLVRERSGVISVAAFSFERNIILPYSGKGNISAPVGRYFFAPVE